MKYEIEFTLVERTRNSVKIDADSVEEAKQMVKNHEYLMSDVYKISEDVGVEDIDDVTLDVPF